MKSLREYNKIRIYYASRDTNRDESRGMNITKNNALYKGCNSCNQFDLFSICSDLSLDVRTCQRWFARFSSGDFDLNDKDRPGRPIEANDSLLEELLEQDPRQSTRDLAIQLNCSFNTVLNRLRALGKENLKNNIAYCTIFFQKRNLKGASYPKG